MVQKLVSNATMFQAADMLQVVTPTDPAHEAAWWNTEFGRLLQMTQDNFLKGFPR
jgi:hypothetical protein